MALLSHFPPSRVYGTAYAPSEDEVTKPVKVELARGDLTGRQMDIIVNIFEVPPGATVARHIHPGEEVVYVLEGGTLEQPDGKLLTFETGTALIYARDIPHAWREKCQRETPQNAKCVRRRQRKTYDSACLITPPHSCGYRVAV
jgi:hypothetical protein